MNKTKNEIKETQVINKKYLMIVKTYDKNNLKGYIQFFAYTTGIIKENDILKVLEIVEVK